MKLITKSLIIFFVIFASFSSTLSNLESKEATDKKKTENKELSHVSSQVVKEKTKLNLNNTENVSNTLKTEKNHKDKTQSTNNIKETEVTKSSDFNLQDYLKNYESPLIKKRNSTKSKREDAKNTNKVNPSSNKNDVGKVQESKSRKITLSNNANELEKKIEKKINKDISLISKKINNNKEKNEKSISQDKDSKEIKGASKEDNTMSMIAANMESSSADKSFDFTKFLKNIDSNLLIIPNKSDLKENVKKLEAKINKIEKKDKLDTSSDKKAEYTDTPYFKQYTNENNHQEKENTKKEILEQENDEPLVFLQTIETSENATNNNIKTSLNTQTNSILQEQVSSEENGITKIIPFNAPDIKNNKFINSSLNNINNSFKKTNELKKFQKNDFPYLAANRYEKNTEINRINNYILKQHNFRKKNKRKNYKPTRPIPKVVNNSINSLDSIYNDRINSRKNNSALHKELHSTIDRVTSEINDLNNSIKDHKNTLKRFRILSKRLNNLAKKYEN